MKLGALIATLVLLLANGFFVAVEFALITSRRTKLQSLAEEGNRRAQIALAASRELSLQLAGAQLGVTMASLALGYVAEPAIGHLVEVVLHPLGLPETAVRTSGFALALALVVFLHMVIGEMVPKNLALAGPERAMLVLAWPNRIYVAVFRPIIRALNALANAGVRLFRVEPRSELERAHSANDIAAMLAASREEGLLEPFEHELLSGALDFGDREVSTVMAPRHEVVAVRSTAPVRAIEAVIVERGHSRIPIVGTGLDDVWGFVHAKDLLDLPEAARERPYPVGRLRRMLIVPQDMPLVDVLVRMQGRRLHLAVVIDERRRTMGMVTLEDILESLVGDIRDESDPEPATP